MCFQLCSLCSFVFLLRPCTPTNSPKGVLFNAHVQHNVAWLVVSEIEAYLERIFLSYVHFASILLHTILK